MGMGGHGGRRAHSRYALFVVGVFVSVVLGVAAPAGAGATGVYVSNFGSASLSAFSVGTGGVLSPVECDPMTLCQTGGFPAAVAIDPSATHVYVTYDSGVSVFTIGAGGVLSPVECDPSTLCKTGMFPSGIAVDPSGRLVYTANTGSSSVSVFAIGAGGVLSPVPCDPATICKTEANPYFVAIDPSGSHVYVTNHNPAGSISVFAIGASGALSPVACDPMTICQTGKNPTAVAIDPSGMHLYAINETNSVSVFAIGAGGVLSPVPCDATTICKTGENPSGIAVDPSGSHVYITNSKSNSVSVFAIGAGGVLSPVPCDPATVCKTGSSPAALAVDPGGRHLYVANGAGNSVSVFAIGAGGVLSPVACDATTICKTEKNPFFQSLAITPDQGPTSALQATVGQAGSPTSFDASASRDPDGQIVRFDWDFGDGTSLQNGAAKLQHTYASPGTYTVSVTATDDTGCSTSRVFTGQTASCNGTAAATARATITVLRQGTTTASTTSTLPTTQLVPVLSHVFQTVNRWRLGNRLPRLASKPKVPVGTLFGFTLNQAANVRLAFGQMLAGRRTGHRCAPQSHQNRHKPRCTRVVAAGTLSIPAHAGANRVRFQGRISPTRKLKPGRYRLSITAINLAGKRSAPAALTFTIVKS